MSTLYVFALAGHGAAPFAAHGHRIEFIDFGGVHAAVERAAGRPAVSEGALRAQHDIVMQICTSVDDVLPARFGAYVEQGELTQLLAMRREVIQRALDLVRGRVQMTVRIREPHGTNDPQAPTVAAASGTAYLEARRAAAAGPLSPTAATAAAAVRHLAVSERLDKGTARTPMAIYHLIDKQKVEDYTAALSLLRSSAITVTGPWPPFAFAPDLWP
jgi:gas vesicle protein GvpL/GvpF